MVGDAQHDARVRERSAELLARVDEVLARPRAEGEPWRRPEPEVMRRTTLTPPRPQHRIGSPHTASRGWVNNAIDKAMDALLRGVSSFVVQQRDVLRLRHAESERRLASLEARVTDLERR